MASEQARAIGQTLAIVAVLSLACSWLFHIPYIFTIIGSLMWGIIGIIITLDDDMPGGWSPHPAGAKGALGQLILPISLLVIAIAVAVLFPSIWVIGGA